MAALVICVVPLSMVHCATAPMGPVAMPALNSAMEFDLDQRFAQGLAKFRSTESSSDGWIWDADEFADWALLGVTLKDGRDEDHVWFVRLSRSSAEELSTERFTVSAGLGPLKRGDRFHALASRVRIESFDQDGVQINTSHRTVPVSETNEVRPEQSGGLEALGRVLAQEAQREGELDDASTDDLARLSVSLQEIGRAGALRPIRNAARRSVINEPNILTLILNAFRINVRADFANAELLPEPWLTEFQVSQYVASSPLYIAGQHVLNCRVVLGPSGNPFALTAGVLGFEITHPDHPQNKLTVRLLATKPRK